MATAQSLWAPVVREHAPWTAEMVALGGRRWNFGVAALGERNSRVAGGALAGPRGGGGEMPSARSRSGRRPVALGVMSSSPVLLGFAAAVLLASCGGASDSERIPPPVILITLDTVRADSLGAYGDPGLSQVSTPALDAFSAMADRYRTCISAAPWTMPTHASLFTGLYPFEHGCHSFLPPKGAKADNVFALAGRFETLAEALAARGYRTHGTVSNAAYLRPMLGLEQGFMDWDVERTTAPGVNERALTWLDQNQDGGRPTFLFINYMDAHRPYNTGDRKDGAAKKLDRLITEVMVEGQEGAELGAAVRSLHQKAVTRLDAELGKLFEGLKERGLFDRSLIVITSDHGESFGAHGIVEHSKDVYEDTVKVPLLIKMPGQAVGRVLDERASSIHVPGLIARGLAGTDAETAQGVFPRLPNGAGSPVLTENYFSRIGDLEKFGERFRRRRWGVYEGDLKLIAGSDNSVELYNLKVDPGETQNLAEGQGAGAPVDRLLAGLQARLSGVTAYTGEPELPRPMTREQQRHLNAQLATLGYGGQGDGDEEKAPEDRAPEDRAPKEGDSSQ